MNSPTGKPIGGIRLSAVHDHLLLLLAWGKDPSSRFDCRCQIQRLLSDFPLMFTVISLQLAGTVVVVTLPPGQRTQSFSGGLGVARTWEAVLGPITRPGVNLPGGALPILEEQTLITGSNEAAVFSMAHGATE